MKTKKIKSILLLTITLITFTIGLNIGKVKAIENNKIEVVEVFKESKDDFYLGENDIGVIFSNGSYATANLIDNIYIFQPMEMGDWNYTFDNLEDFQNCISMYVEYSNNK